MKDIEQIGTQIENEIAQVVTGIALLCGAHSAPLLSGIILPIAAAFLILANSSLS